MLPGQVIRIRFPYSSPPKYKYCLAICLTEKLFFIISSARYSMAPADSQVKLFKQELDCLSYDSWLDVSKAYTFEARDIATAEADGVYSLAKSGLERIKFAVSSQPYLPEKQKKLVLQNL